jgi:hypothetical protein
MDDVPTVDPEMYNLSHTEKQPTPNLRARVKVYFMNKNSHVTSHVFGTLVAFFMIGLRVEHFLHTEAIVSNNFITFGLDVVASFWILPA